MFTSHLILLASTVQHAPAPSLAIDLNPLDWLSGPVDFLKNLGKIFDGLGGFFSGIVELVTGDVGAFFKRFFGWALHFIFPKELSDFFFQTIQGQLPDDSHDVYLKAYDASAPAGLFIAAGASGARIVRVLLDTRAPSSILFADVFPRFAASICAIGVGGVYPAKTMIQFAITASALVGQAGWNTFFGVLGVSDWHALGVTTFFDLAAGNLLGIGIINIFMLIGALLALIMIIYCTILLLARSIMLGFSVAVAPLCIACAAFDHKSKFVQWWWEMFTGALAVPLVMGACLSITFAVTISMQAHGGAAGPFIAVIILCGGCWFTAKTVHQLTWKHFNHGTIKGALFAGAGTLALDVNAVRSGLGFLQSKTGGGAGGAGGGGGGTTEAVKNGVVQGLVAAGLAPATGGASLAAAGAGGAGAAGAGAGAAGAGGPGAAAPSSRGLASNFLRADEKGLAGRHSGGLDGFDQGFHDWFGGNSDQRDALSRAFGDIGPSLDSDEPDVKSRLLDHLQATDGQAYRGWVQDYFAASYLGAGSFA